MRKDRRDLWERVFDAVAGSLQWLATKLDPFIPGGMNYVKINVIGFCVILPVVLLTSFGLNAWFLLAL